MLSYMNKLLKSLPKDKNNLVLVVLLSVFIVMDVKIPNAISKVVDTIVGKSLVILASLSLFGINSLVGVLGLVAGYLLIQRSAQQEDVKMYDAGEENKIKYLHTVNQFPLTVEEDVISKMLPRASPDIIPPEYKPTLNKLHNASNL